MNPPDTIIHVYRKRVNLESLRVFRSTDITKVRVVYAEFETGVPMDDDELLELDEKLMDWLHAVWADCAQGLKMTQVYE